MFYKKKGGGVENIEMTFAFSTSYICRFDRLNEVPIHA